jgi:hypothetical protein
MTENSSEYDKKKKEVYLEETKLAREQILLTLSQINDDTFSHTTKTRWLFMISSPALLIQAHCNSANQMKYGRYLGIKQTIGAFKDDFVFSINSRKSVAKPRACVFFSLIQ